jgi:serine/threonine protein kinase
MGLLREWLPRRKPHRLPVYPDGLVPGMKVGAWRVVRKLGSGGAGAVYLVKRRGRRFALKLAVRPEDRRFLRERRLLERVQHPNVVGLRGHGWWPQRQGGFPYLVMEYVEGLPLYAWARATNPTPRQAAVVLAKVTRALEAMHQQQAVHRDVKGDNTLVCPGEQEPVLVDLGAGDYVGATSLTGQVLPPVSEPYLSPEAMAFARQHVKDTQARYEARPSDDLYALGVMAHRLLTDEYPFSLNVPRDMFWMMVETWPAPHASQANPRVPPVLAAIVQRLLAKRPEERYASARELAEALLQAAREGGPEWDEPLFEWYSGPGPASRTTQAVAPAGPVAPGDVVALRLAQQQHRQKQEWLRLRRMVRRRSSPSARKKGASPPPVAAGPPVRSRLSGWGGGLLLAVALGGFASVALLEGVTSPIFQEPPAFPTAEVGKREWEVARPVVSPEAELGAVPPGASTPAPVANATQDEEDTRVKEPIRKTEPPHPQQQPSPEGKKALRPSRHFARIAPLCVGLACATAPEQKRPVLPPPEECPPGAVAAMVKLGISIGEVNPVSGGPGFVPPITPARAGPINFFLIDAFGDLPSDTRLSGQLFIGEQRIYGRFTEAQLPDGRTFPVCMELSEGDRGLSPSRQSTPEEMKLYPAGDVRAVDRFE